MSKYAVIETGGRQYRVEKDEEITIEKLPGHQPGDSVTFDRVLMVRDGKKLKVGQPFVDGAEVKGKISEVLRGDKITVFYYKRKTRRQRKMGHRQTYMKAQIEEIKA
jgi:large subunit ribosomal protein L21